MQVSHRPADVIPAPKAKIVPNSEHDEPIVVAVKKTRQLCDM